MAREGHGPRPDARSGERSPHGDRSSHGDMSGRKGIISPEEKTRQDHEAAVAQTTKLGSHSQASGESTQGFSGTGATSTSSTNIGGSITGGLASVGGKVSTEDADVLDTFYDFGPQEEPNFESTLSDINIDSQTPSARDGIIGVIICVDGEPFNAYISGSFTGKVS